MVPMLVRILRDAGQGDSPWGYWQIHAGDEVIGDIEFHGPPDMAGIVEIGYEIVPAWQRRGVATWAVGELLTIGIEHGVQEFRAEVHGDNIASVRVLQRSGFTGSGTEADTTLWTHLVDPHHSPQTRDFCR